MFILAGLCLLAGILPGLAIDALAPVTQSLVGASLPVQSDIAWLSIAPIAGSRSSYNGFLVLVFIAASASLAAWFIHRFASRALRRAPAWGCGFPEFSASAQYAGGSFAQPIRRVFGSLIFQAREHVDMPAPGDVGPARFKLEMRDLIWDGLYAPIGAAALAGANRLNRLQFLTIRQYLSVVFVCLVTLLLGLALWR